VILPKAVTTTDADGFSVKSADYSANNDIEQPIGQNSAYDTVWSSGLLCVRRVLAVEFRSTLGFE
jgi:hypothetical protein